MENKMKKILGLVEGFYGNPWSHEDRIGIIKKIGEFGFNTYVYAPKDDPYHRDKWRDDYPEPLLSNLVHLVKTSQSAGVDFFFTVSPGGEVSYSSQEDYEALMKKLKSLYEHGVMHYGVFFDDIAFELPEGEDKKRFGSIDKAQNYFIKKVYEGLKDIDPKIVLSTCPTLYHGRGDEDYIRSFAKELPKDIYLFWTGREVCSQVLSGPDAELFTQKTGHRPTYWDNYPVNDSIMKWEFHLGPYDKRDYEIVEASDGLVLNPMEYSQSSLIAIETAAEFFKKPETYKKFESWERVLKKQVPENIFEAYKHFASFCFKSCVYPYFSNKFLMAELMENMNKPDWRCGEFLYQEGVKGLDNAKILLSNRDIPLVKEALPWIKKFQLLMKLFISYRNKKGFIGKIKYNRLLKKFILNRYEIFQLEVFNEIDKG